MWWIRMIGYLGLVAGMALTLTGCDDEGEVDSIINIVVTSDAQVHGDEDPDASSPGADATPGVDANGLQPDAGGPPPSQGRVWIEGVQVYQINPRQIASGDGQGGLLGHEPGDQLPLVSGKPALVRVFVESDEDVDGGQLSVWLTVGDAAPLETVLSGPLNPSEAALGSTANFEIPGALISEGVTVRVELRRGDETLFAWPGEGGHPLDVTSVGEAFRLTLVPVRYDADGSGRTPDVSAARLEVIRQRMLRLFPFPDVVISVADPIPWAQPIEPFGQGWQEIAMAIFQLRARSGAPDHEYFYGLFMPTETTQAFCAMGCLLGLTLLNEPYQPELNLALGVGFSDETSIDTLMHELLHAHGLQHAPCGPGLDPSSIDRDYPDPRGAVGSWGYDPEAEAMVNPSASDIMGYCPNKWISDYHLDKTMERAQLVARRSQKSTAAEMMFSVMQVHADGALIPAGRHLGRVPPEAASLTRLIDAQTGASHEGFYYPFSHLPGGWLFVPEE